jgi:hypothetical protein
MKMTLTKKLMYAVQLDAYNAAKRRGHSQEDAADIGQAEFNRLFEFIGGPEGWMDLPNA